MIPVASGAQAHELWTSAAGDYRVAVAAHLTGLATAATDLAWRYAVERKAFGSPIAGFQAISHTLVDCVAATDTARNLTRRASWLHEHEPRCRPGLSAMALTFAASTPPG
ncbi:hypothetical protein GCM10009836_25010 [Pseudonocardia ailaonensis]|uniref:Acyl-CoA dehydrogenase/oxidase C-terminal domain-containing protein n=1 Tax=Pseudonocardia ailaonensis TaxID=367279 RepID=A0ABN2N1Y7_9PSEU